jgi:hypothetical protein
MYVHVCMCMCTYVYMCIHKYVTCMYVCMCVCVYVCMYVCMYGIHSVYVRERVCVCVRD